MRKFVQSGGGEHEDREHGGSEHRSWLYLAIGGVLSALLHNGSTLLLSMDCLTPLLTEIKI